jgi:hypothetical protein
MQRDAIHLILPDDGAGDLAIAVLSTVVIVTANCDAVAVNGREFKTRADISPRLAWRAAEWVGVAAAADLLNDRGWPGWRWWWWWRVATSSSASNGNSEDGEDLSELHLYRR